MQPITERINRQMSALGWSLTQTAEAANIPRNTLKRRLTHPATFTIDELSRLFDALGIKASTINVRDVA